MNVFDEEYWKDAYQFPNYSVSSRGRIWDKQFDEEVPQRFVQSANAMCVVLKNGPNEFRGAVWQMMYATFWQAGWGIGIDVSYRDDNPRNLSIFNLLFSKDGVPLIYRLDEVTGLWYRRRKGARKVRIVETGEVFENVQAVAAHLPNGSSNMIYMCLRGVQQTHKGYHFEWAED